MCFCWELLCFNKSEKILEGMDTPQTPQSSVKATAISLTLEETLMR